MIETQEEDGFYWKEPGTKLWSGRFRDASFRSDKKDEVIICLKEKGAIQTIDVTDQGGAEEFGCAGDRSVWEGL